MKKYLVLFFLLASLTSFGQFSNYTNINGRYKWIAGKFDSTFTLPSGTTPSLRVGGGTGPGALFYSTTDSSVYQYTGTQWTRLRGTDTAHVISAYIRNTTGSILTPGQVVYINGSTGTTPTVALAVNTADSTSAMTFGFVRGTIAINGFGWITSYGPLEGVNTNAYTEGEVIYLDSIPGQFTHDKPQAPYHMVTLGYIVKKSGGNGTIFAKIQNGYELDELHNVRITEPVLNKSVIIYDSVRRLWVDTTVSAAGLGLGGSGTTNYLSKWTSSTALGNSLVFDNGTNVGINNTNPTYRLDVTGTARINAKSVSATTSSMVVGDDIAPSTSGSRTKIVVGNTSGNSEFIIGQGGTNNLLFNWTYNATAGSAYGVLETYSGNNPLVLQSAGGNVLVGTTTNAGYRLDVSGTFRSTGAATIGTNLALNSTIPGTLASSNTISYLFAGTTGVIQADVGNTPVLFGSNNYWNGTNNVRKATGFVHYMYIDGSGDLGFYSAGSGAAGSTVSATQNVTFKNGGNVGIGTASPAYKLDVNGTSRVQASASVASILFVSNTSSGQYPGGIEVLFPNQTSSSVQSAGIYIGQAQSTRNGYGLSYVHNSSGSTSNRGSISFYNVNDIINWFASGNVAIGTTTDAGYKLDVNGTARVSGATYLATGSGNVGINTTSPSYRLDVVGNGRFTMDTYITGGGFQILGALSSPIGSGGFELEYSGGIAYVTAYNRATSGWVPINIRSSYTSFTTSNVERMRLVDGGLGIGTTSPNASALLDVSSTTKGFLPPRMTNAQMVAIATPAAGLVVYDTTNNKLNVYDGTNWVTLH